MSRPRPDRRLVFLAVGLLVLPMGAVGGGSWMAPTEESYEPGDEVEAVAYVGGAVPEEAGRYRAYLATTPISDGEVSDWLDVGPVSIEPTGRPGDRAARVYLRFTVPESLEDGVYSVSIRNEEGNFFGDLIGMELHVGVARPGELTYEWPLDEPLIAELPEGAVIVGPGSRTQTASERSAAPTTEQRGASRRGDRVGDRRDGDVARRRAEPAPSAVGRGPWH